MSAANTRRDPQTPPKALPRWLLGLGPLILIAALVGLFTLLNAPGLAGVSGEVPPDQTLNVENVRLEENEIILTVRNIGVDPVRIAQVSVSDFYASFTQTSGEIAPLQSGTITITYPWVAGDPYEVVLITSIGDAVSTEIEAASLSPERGASFFGLMVILGVYVGVIPIGLGMLWLPFVRRASSESVRFLLAFTVGLLAYLTFDATLEGVSLVATTAAFGGPIVVFLGALVAYLILEGIEGWVQQRQRRPMSAGQEHEALTPRSLSTLIATGIGLHNLGEGLAIGSAYAIGSIALGTFLVIGFAIHNTTEGLAIVAPLATQRPRVSFLVLLGAIAGTPAVIGALIGATVYQPTIAAFLLGIGAGAVAQVAIKILPLLRNERGRALTPANASGVVLGIAFMFATGLLVVA
jgi:zinc transporter, ZIP family